LRHGYRPPTDTKAWTEAYRRWIAGLHCSHPAQEATRLDYLTEVDHARERVARLEQAIDTAVATTPAPMRAVIEALQALRGVAKLAAVTIVAEVGQLSRFAGARQLMGYSGVVASEHSSGGRVRRGGITKTGNAHLRRIVVEAAWSYRHRPALGGALRQRQAQQSETVKAIAWKAQHRLHSRYSRLLGRGKSKQQVVTAVAREPLGFIWAIGVAVEGELPRTVPGRVA
jgi:transposase